MSRRSTRNLNIEETLARYRTRVTALPREEFLELEGSYLSSFDVFSTFAEAPPSSVQSHAFVLMQVAREKGVEIRGVTSERKRAGQYICQQLLGEDTRENARCVYTGKYSYFTGHVQSKWAIRPSDRVYVPPSTSSEESTTS